MHGLYPYVLSILRSFTLVFFFSNWLLPIFFVIPLQLVKFCHRRLQNILLLSRKTWVLFPCPQGFGALLFLSSSGSGNFFPGAGSDSGSWELKTYFFFTVYKLSKITCNMCASIYTYCIVFILFFTLEKI